LLFVIPGRRYRRGRGLLYRSQQDRLHTGVEHKLAAVAESEGERTLDVEEGTFGRRRRLFIKNKAFSALVRRCIEAAARLASAKKNFGVGSATSRPAYGYDRAALLRARVHS